jgi:hypothetical protein
MKIRTYIRIVWVIIMKITYTLTHLEEFISNLYRSLVILKPHQISEEDIAEKLGIMCLWQTKNVQFGN